MTEPDTILADIIRTRRTIHDFLPEVPPREAILQAIELARWAPNHRHTEPWRFHLLGEQAKSKVVDLNARIVAAKSGFEAGEAKRKRWSEVPGWLVVTCARSDDPVLDNEDYAATCCAIQNFSLYLWSRSIGVKWTTGGVTRHPEFFELLGLDPDANRTVALLWYGYPASVPNQQRKAVDEIIVELD